MIGIMRVKNEARWIDRVLASILPLCERVLVMDDGSTDGTDELVSLYTALHDWIELVQMPPRAERHFGGKALAIRAGLERLKDVPYDLQKVAASFGQAATALQTNLTVSVSQLSDTDYASAITKLNTEEVSLQAAQESYASISKLSLFNYIQG